MIKLLLGVLCCTTIGFADQQALLKGYIHAPTVRGVHYQTPSFQGKLDADGGFHYQKSDYWIKLIADGKVLGKAVPGSTMTLADFFDGKIFSDYFLQNLIFLMTHDVDQNLSTGITYQEMAWDVSSSKRDKKELSNWINELLSQELHLYDGNYQGTFRAINKTANCNYEGKIKGWLEGDELQAYFLFDNETSIPLVLHRRLRFLQGVGIWAYSTASAKINNHNTITGEWIYTGQNCVVAFSLQKEETQ